MFGIDPEVRALPVTMAGKNMIRLVNGRARAHGVEDELRSENGEQKSDGKFEQRAGAFGG